MYEGREK